MCNFIRNQNILLSNLSYRLDDCIHKMLGDYFPGTGIVREFNRQVGPLHRFQFVKSVTELDKGLCLQINTTNRDGKQAPLVTILALY